MDTGGNVTAGSEIPPTADKPGRRLAILSPSEAVQRTLDSLDGQGAIEAEIAAQLAEAAPLADPARFLEANRALLRALEVFVRDGWRVGAIGRLGPLEPLARQAIEFVAWYVVRGYAASITNRLLGLYATREAQSEPLSAERRLLRQARLDLERLAPRYGGGARLPALLAGGALVGWASSLTGLVSPGLVWVDIAGVAILLALFVGLAWVLLRGAAVAHRRIRLVVEAPLAVLWATIGRCGGPPRDRSALFATAAIGLTAAAWFVLPVLAAGLILLF